MSLNEYQSNPNEYNPFRTNDSGAIKILRLIAQETGTYNPVYQRPYKTNVTNDIINTVSERIDAANNHNITSSIFSGIAGSIITPSATPGSEIFIPNGWNERRIRFILEVEVMLSTGIPLVIYYQGFTNYLGISSSGNIDPQMEFIINSFIAVRRVNVNTGFAIQTHDSMMECSNILNGKIFSGNNNQQSFAMRPTDMFSGMQSNIIKDSLRASNGGVGITDTRIGLTNKNLGSNRSNNLAASYLSRLFDNFNQSTQMMDYGQGESDVLESARQRAYANESDIGSNVFLRKLSSMKGYNNVSSFTFSDLVKIDSNVPKVTNYIVLGATAKQQLHHSGQTSYWNASDRETHVATILSNAVSAIAMEFLISKVGFRSTNNDVAGVPNTVFFDVKSLTNADVSLSCHLFKTKLEKEILYDITHGNQDTYMLEMYVDMFGESKISLSIGGSPMVTYTTPSFCDSLLSPVVTFSEDNYHTNAYDFQNITSAVSSMKSSVPMVNSLV